MRKFEMKAILKNFSAFKILNKESKGDSLKYE